MKKLNEKIKNLVSKEYNVNLIKIFITLFVYFVIIAIFYAGYEYQNVSKVREQKKEKFVQYKYFLRVNNGKEIIYTTKEPKGLFSILNDIDSLVVDFNEYYEGKQILKINNSQNFDILVNDKKIESKFYETPESPIEDRADIDILIY
jgi:hypothetical protein